MQHLDKKVLLWHCEAPLFFKSVCGVNKILTVKFVLANKRTCEKCLSHHRMLLNTVMLFGTMGENDKFVL